jgi:tetratricopeptide (TPR) repeat protein
MNWSLRQIEGITNMESLQNSQDRLMNWSRLPAYWCLIILGMAAAFGSVDKQIEIGLNLLEEEQFQEAREAFSLGVRQAEQSSDREREGKLRFYLGLTLQRHIASLSNSHPDRGPLLQDAKEQYERATRLLPRSAGVFNNLARIYEDLGEQERARLAFRSAIEVADERQALYAVNYADFLSRCGEARDAVRFYELALSIQPMNDRAHQALLRHYQREDPWQVGAYLRRLLDRGLLSRVFNSATTILKEDNSRLSEDQAVELLTIVVRCLTRLSYQPEDILQSAYSERLEALVEGRWGQAIRQIMTLYHGEQLKPVSYPWWAERTGPSSERPPGGWPLEVFNGLARSLGERAMRQQAYETAEAYYKLAFRMNPRSPDGKALVNLVDLYVGSGRRGELEQLLNHERELYQAKGSAYETMDREKIYEYHRALGIVYSYLGRWGSEGEVQSAVFQLNHALEAAELYNQSVGASSGAELLVEPRLVGLLATGYTAVGQAHRAFEVRVKTADSYKRLGVSDAATQVFRPIVGQAIPSSTSSDTRSRYNTLNSAFGRFGFERVSPGAKSLERKLERPVLRYQPTMPTRSIRGGDSVIVRFVQPKGSSLSRREIDQLAATLQSVIRESSSKKRGADSFFLLPASLQDEIVEVVFDGKRGSVQFKQGTETVDVPFALVQSGGAKVEPFRAIHP